jgi:hypothetical protein
MRLRTSHLKISGFSTPAPAYTKWANSTSRRATSGGFIFHYRLTIKQRNANLHSSCFVAIVVPE